MVLEFQNLWLVSCSNCINCISSWRFKIIYLRSLCNCFKGTYIHSILNALSQIVSSLLLSTLIHLIGWIFSLLKTQIPIHLTGIIGTKAQESSVLRDSAVTILSRVESTWPMEHFCQQASWRRSRQQKRDTTVEQSIGILFFQQPRKCGM